jgi:hypothetical protein
MKKTKRVGLTIPGQRCIALVGGLVLSLALLLSFVPVSAADVSHQVTNVRDKAFTVTWVTDANETGYVRYGIFPGSLTSTAYDERGQTTAGDTHHVSITGLTAGTTYYYEIVSGDITYNDSGNPYQMTTGPELIFAMPEIISGKVYKADGVTAAEGTIVYISISSSQVLSSLVNTKGVWALDIAPIRAGDYQDYFTYTNGDQISLEAEGGNSGMIAETVTVAAAQAGTPEMTLVGGTDQGTTTSGDNTGTGSVSTEETQSGQIQLWVWLVGGIVVLGATGLLLKKFVFYHD